MKDTPFCGIIYIWKGVYNHVISSLNYNQYMAFCHVFHVWKVLQRKARERTLLCADNCDIADGCMLDEVTL